MLDQLPHINDLKSDSSNLKAHFPLRSQATLAPINNPTYIINPQPVRLSNSILNSEFNNDILDTLVPNLIPNLNELELLGHKV